MKASSLLGHTREVLSEILVSGRPADRVFDAFFRKRRYLGSRDRRVIAELGYGALRHLRRSQMVVTETLVVRPEELATPEAVRATLLAYLVSMSDLERGKGLEPQALLDAVDPLEHELVERLRHAHQHLLKRKDLGVGVVFSFPDWMVERFAAEFPGQELEGLLLALNEQAPISLRVNTLRTTVEACRERLEAEGVPTRPGHHSPLALQLMRRINVFALPSFRDGLFEMQDEGSQIVPILLDPKPTAKVLDACAGAGGKTLEFAALMENRGEIVAGDVSAWRLGELRRRARRAGASNVRVQELDLLKPIPDGLSAKFDVVLVDAPCSGVGTIRRNPGMKWNVTGGMLRGLSETQLTMLKHSAPAVKPGGRLAYSTCTLFREENEDVVNAFLAAHPEFSILPLSQLNGGTRFVRRDDDPFLHLLPHRDGTDGFFLAVLQRR